MRKKIILSVVLSIFLLLGGLGVTSYLSVNESIQRSLDNHLQLAKIAGKYFDQLLEDNLSRLGYTTISAEIDLHDQDWGPERKVLQAVHQYSIFTDLVFFLDANGTIVLSYPYQAPVPISLREVPYVRQALAERKSSISDVYRLASDGEQVVFALVPLFDQDGEFIGIVGGEINPRKFVLTEIMKELKPNDDLVIELVDSNGIIISSNRPDRILTASDHNEFLRSLIASKESSVGRCHRCHTEETTPKTRDMLAFSPLNSAPWGVAVREPEESVFAPSRNLQKAFLALTAIAVLAAIIIVVDINRNLVLPVRLLIRASKRIADGNLEEPVEVDSRDEIETLAKSFDEMRARLAAGSLAEIRLPDFPPVCGALFAAARAAGLETGGGSAIVEAVSAWCKDESAARSHRFRSRL